MSDSLTNPPISQSNLPFWQQIRWQLVATYLLASIVPVLFIASIALARFTSTSQTQAVNQLESVTELKRNQIEQWLSNGQAALEQFAAGPRTPRFIQLAQLQPDSDQYLADTASFHKLLNEVIQAQNFFVEIFAYDTDGNIIISSNQTQEGKLVSSQPFFNASLNVSTGSESEHLDSIQPPYYDLATGELTIIITHALIDESTGDVGAVLAGRLNLDTLSNIMLEREGLGDTGETYLVSQESNYLLTPSRFEEEGYEQNRAYHSYGIDNALTEINGSALYDDYRDLPVLGVYRWLPELNVALMGEINRDEVLAPVNTIRIFVVGLTAIIIAIAIPFGLFIAGRIANPLTNLTETATQIASGNLEKRVVLPQQNEIGLLATAFNSMAEQLQNFIAGLEERVAERTQALVTSTEVSRRLSTILDQDTLVKEVVAQVKESFDYYHAHIYLYDEARTQLVMVGGTGEAGQKMLADGHRIENGRGLVGRAADTNQVILVSDVTKDETWLPNPLLPETKAETAVPIAISNTVLGVLDVQHNIVNGLQQEDADLLQSVANQIAIALQNARLYEDTQQRARQEALLRSINQKIVSTNNIETAMKVAIREIGQALGADQTVIRLGQQVPTQTIPTNGDNTPGNKQTEA